MHGGRKSRIEKGRCIQVKSIKIQKLGYENFNKYGTFHNMINPDTEILASGNVEFHRDITKVTLGMCTQPSFSVTHIKKRPMIVEKLEYHDRTGEAFMPLDGDIVIHLAPASKPADIPYNKLEAFLVPQGTLITINPGVWHQAPYAADQEEVNVLVVLPERTYANDCKLVILEEEKQLLLE